MKVGSRGMMGVVTDACIEVSIVFLVVNIIEGASMDLKNASAEDIT